jgi:hypothetical protein
MAEGTSIFTSGISTGHNPKLHYIGYDNYSSALSISNLEDIPSLLVAV